MKNTEVLIPLGLLAAWTINDLEEWFTFAPWTSLNANRLQSLPVKLPWPNTGISSRQAHLAIGLVGAGIFSATVKGVRSKGRSPFYRATLLAFGLHGFTHAAQSLALRSYTPGVITGITVVVPFWLWARAQQSLTGTLPRTWKEWAAAGSLLALLPAVIAVSGAVDQRLPGK